MFTTRGQKSDTFFEITDAIAKLGGLPLVGHYNMVISNDMEAKVCKLKDKWIGEFDSLSRFSDENIRDWKVDYVNLNNNISSIIN
jgi:hypothetical protein